MVPETNCLYSEIPIFKNMNERTNDSKALGQVAMARSQSLSLSSYEYPAGRGRTARATRSRPVPAAVGAESDSTGLRASGFPALSAPN